MDKKIYYILGTIFIITSGLIYTFERFIPYSSWTGQSGSFSQSGSLSTYTMALSNSPFSNVFIFIFIIIGVISLHEDIQKNNKHLNNEGIQPSLLFKDFEK